MIKLTVNSQDMLSQQLKHKELATKSITVDTRLSEI